MGLDNPIHLLLLLVILLLVFGARRLQEMGRSLGDGLRGFKEAMSGEQSVGRLDAAPQAPAAEAVSETTASDQARITG